MFAELLLLISTIMGLVTSYKGYKKDNGDSFFKIMGASFGVLFLLGILMIYMKSKGKSKVAVASNVAKSTEANLISALANKKAAEAAAIA